MLLTKTIKLKLYLNSEQITLFKQMSEQYRLACNFVSQYIFDNNFDLNSNRLNKELYRCTRLKFNLKSQLTQSVFRTAVARYKTAREQLAQKPYRYKDELGEYQKITRTLEWLIKPVVFRHPQCDLVRDRDYSFVDNGLRLSINTLGKRVKICFEDKHWQEYLDGSWSLGTAKLLELKGKWYLHIPVTKNFEEFDKESQRCPKCGSINKANRHHNIHEYICRCGYRSNDDRVGAMNIQLLGTLWISGDERPHFEKITTSD
ncbi:MAG: transposase [Selenomonadaceae bacterium]|nr:transposase [Selenomonadaceae bacterium]